MKPLGLSFAANVAIYLAEQATGKTEPPSCVRDYGYVRAIACVLLRETGASYPDIAEQIYGKRWLHSTVMGHIEKWRDRPATRYAMARFVGMLNNERHNTSQAS